MSASDSAEKDMLCDAEQEWSVESFLAECDAVRDNPPPTPPGLELIECDAIPRHWPTYVAHVEGMYPAYCEACAWEAGQPRREELEHRAFHRRRQTWRITHWLALHGYSWGLLSGSSHSWPPCCGGERVTLNWRGRRVYFFGKPREWWSCLRRGHIYRPLEGRTFHLCAICCPCSGCRSTDPMHHDSIDCPLPPGSDQS